MVTVPNVTEGDSIEMTSHTLSLERSYHDAPANFTRSCGVLFVSE